MDDAPSSLIPEYTVAEIAGSVAWERVELPGGYVAFARSRLNHAPLVWCCCMTCYGVDLYGYAYAFAPAEERGCPWCNGKPAQGTMTPMAEQEAACAAFLVGGLRAVSVLARSAVDRADSP